MVADSSAAGFRSSAFERTMQFLRESMSELAEQCRIMQFLGEAMSELAEQSRNMELLSEEMSEPTMATPAVVTDSPAAGVPHFDVPIVVAFGVWLQTVGCRQKAPKIRIKPLLVEYVTLAVLGLLLIAVYTGAPGTGAPGLPDVLRAEGRAGDLRLPASAQVWNRNTPLSLAALDHDRMALDVPLAEAGGDRSYSCDGQGSRRDDDVDGGFYGVDELLGDMRALLSFVVGLCACSRLELLRREVDADGVDDPSEEDDNWGDSILVLKQLQLYLYSI
jgi:hypothetical protein